MSDSAADSVRNHFARVLSVAVWQLRILAAVVDVFIVMLDCVVFISTNINNVVLPWDAQYGAQDSVVENVHRVWHFSVPFT